MTLEAIDHVQAAMPAGEEEGMAPAAEKMR